MENRSVDSSAGPEPQVHRKSSPVSIGPTHMGVDDSPSLDVYEPSRDWALVSCSPGKRPYTTRFPQGALAAQGLACFSPGRALTARNLFDHTLMSKLCNRD